MNIIFKLSNNSSENLKNQLCFAAVDATNAAEGSSEVVPLARGDIEMTESHLRIRSFNFSFYVFFLLNKRTFFNKSDKLHVWMYFPR